MLNTKEFIKLKTANPAQPQPLDLEEQKLVELAYRDEIGPKRKSVRILGQIAEKANLLGDAAKKKSAEEEKMKLNEEIRTFCADALSYLAKIPELDADKGQRQATTIQ